MVLTLFTGFGFTANHAVAGAIQFDPQCWAQADAYLLKTDKSGKNGTAPGARLWDLDKLRAAWYTESTPKMSATCSVDKILKQALADQNEYWDSIGKKYSCDPKKLDYEAETPCGRYVGNHLWLGFFDKLNTQLAQFDKSNCSPKGATPLTAQAGSNIKDTSKVVAPLINSTLTTQKDIDTRCANVPLGYRTTVEEQNSTLNRLLGRSTIVQDCLAGIVKEIVKEATSVYNGMKSLWKTGFLTGLHNLYAQIKDDPVGMVYNLYVSTLRYFTEDFDDFRCLNNAEQNTRVCQAVSKAAIAYFSGVLAGKAVGLVARGAMEAGSFVVAKTGIKAGLQAAAETSAGKVVVATANATAKTYNAAKGALDKGMKVVGKATDVVVKPVVDTTAEWTAWLKDAVLTNKDLANAMREFRKAGKAGRPEGPPRLKGPLNPEVTSSEAYEAYEKGLEDLKKFEKRAKEPGKSAKPKECRALLQMAAALFKKVPDLAAIGYNAAGPEVQLAYEASAIDNGCAPYGIIKDGPGNLAKAAGWGKHKVTVGVAKTAYLSQSDRMDREKEANEKVYSAEAVQQRQQEADIMKSLNAGAQKKQQSETDESGDDDGTEVGSDKAQ